MDGEDERDFAPAKPQDVANFFGVNVEDVVVTREAGFWVHGGPGPGSRSSRVHFMSSCAQAL